MSDTSAKVSVTALKFHTRDGEEHQAGDTYSVEAHEVDNLVAQGMAKPSEQVKADEAAAKEADRAAKAAEKAAAKASNT